VAVRSFFHPSTGKDNIMTQVSHATETEASSRHAAKEKLGDGMDKDAASQMGDFFQTLNPEKIFSYIPVSKADLEPVFAANIDLMRTFDGMFQSWAAGFSSRNQERIHTLEECLKCSSQAEMMKIQNECLQRLTKHWIADTQKLGGVFFDAFGKAFKENNSWATSAMKKAAEGVRVA
jgi:hypothetical protein